MGGWALVWLGCLTISGLLASIARKLYLRQGIGIGTFKRIYGRSERRGVRPNRFRESSGSVARWVLKELERLKVVEKDKNGYVVVGCWLLVLLSSLFTRSGGTHVPLFSAAGSLPQLVSAIWTALLALSPPRTPLLLLLFKL